MKIGIHFVSLQEGDIDQIVFAFKEIGWDKPRKIYETYLLEQANNTRVTLVAKENDTFCGYVTIKWTSDYPKFNQLNIPEISDLNVLPTFREKGIGTALIKQCENLAKERAFSIIGLGVGLTSDYGNAQRLYVRLGFIPDGNGIYYRNKPVKYSEVVTVDDDLQLYFIKQL